MSDLNISYIWSIPQENLMDMLTKCYEGEKAPLEVVAELHENSPGGLCVLVDESEGATVISEEELDKIISKKAWKKSG